jgi:hypothetical protein
MQKQQLALTMQLHVSECNRASFFSLLLTKLPQQHCHVSSHVDAMNMDPAELLAVTTFCCQEQG